MPRSDTLPHGLGTAVHRYLRVLDRVLPSRIVGFYLVGSVALGAFRPRRSDIDFIAVVDEELANSELRRLRLAQFRSGARSGAVALRHGLLAFPGTFNGVFVRAADLELPVSQIVPLASQAGHQFTVGRGFDVNPVVWKVFADRGIAMRGPDAGELGLRPQPELLQAWNLENLDAYWRPWAEARQRRPGSKMRLLPRWSTAWGVLGAPRLHHTIATGEVASKEAAGEYALDEFGPRWRPIIEEGLGYWRGEPADPAFRDVRVRGGATAGFVLEVVGAARTLGP